MDPWYLTALGNAYRRLAGPNTTPCSIPLAILRRLYGDDYVVRLQGKPFTVDLNDTVIAFDLLVYRVWEKFESRLLRELIAPGWHIIDVGANVGYYSVLFGDGAGTGGRVLAIEPEPNNARLLRKNIIDRRLSSIVEVAETAVGDAAGIAFLEKASSGNQGATKVAGVDSSGAQATSGLIEVPIALIDNLVAGWPRVDLVKVDIEGYEMRAALGMRSTLARNSRVVLLTEFSPLALRQAGSDPLEYVELLRDFKFQIWEIHEDKRRLERWESGEHPRLVDRVRKKPTGYSNLLCARTEEAIRPLRAFAEN